RFTDFLKLSRPAHRSTLFPYTTLFRSRRDDVPVKDWLRKVVGRPTVEQAPRDAGQPHDEHRHEDDVHADEHAGKVDLAERLVHQDRKSTRLNSSHRTISYAVFCLKKKN